MPSKIAELFSLSNADCAIFLTLESVHDPHFYYFTQLGSSQSNCAVVLHRGKKPVVLCGPLEYGNLKGNRSFRTILCRNAKEKESRLQETLPQKEWVDVTPWLGELRETKTAEELKKIREAVNITEETLAKAPQFIKLGMRERELSAQLEFFGKKAGASELAFPTICAFGKNSVVPHHSTGNAKLKRRDLVLVDFGLKVEGYCADLTRTFIFGKPTQKQQFVYEKVFEAKERATKLVKQGAMAKEVYNAANDCIVECFGSGMVHSIGHGLGLEVHDFPTRMGASNERKLEENMVVTIEPGYYDPGWGGVRIEDDVLVQKNGCKRLSQAPKELESI